jgi:hypothetical protein
MFEGSLLASGRRGRGGGRALGVAVVAHAGVLSAVMVANVWRVEAVEPPVQ